MTEIMHVVFDIGRVLVHWDAEIPYRRLIPDDAERKHFLTNICSPEWNREQDRGRDWTEAEDLLIANHPQYGDLIRAYRLHWTEMVPHALDESVATMRSLLDQGRDVTLLTNFNQETYLEAEEKFPFLKEPRGVTVSGRIRQLKPDRKIFDYHTKTFNLSPDKTLFFDDSQANVEGARAAGWVAELFTSPAQMLDDLRNRDLL